MHVALHDHKCVDIWRTLCGYYYSMEPQDGSLTTLVDIAIAYNYNYVREYMCVHIHRISITTTTRMQALITV